MRRGRYSTAPRVAAARRRASRSASRQSGARCARCRAACRARCSHTRVRCGSASRRRSRARRVPLLYRAPSGRRCETHDRHLRPSRREGKASGRRGRVARSNGRPTPAPAPSRQPAARRRPVRAARRGAALRCGSTRDGPVRITMRSGAISPLSRSTAWTSNGWSPASGKQLLGSLRQGQRPESRARATGEDRCPDAHAARSRARRIRGRGVVQQCRDARDEFGGTEGLGEQRGDRACGRR